MFDDSYTGKRREIGARIKKRRLEIGLTQQELAEALGHGSSHRINQIELGRLRLYAEELPKLCWTLDCLVSDIVPGEPAKGIK
ncbi:helix-turn-helix transcriptional regulator [Ruegeria sp. PrR005]|uniref:Helix-turn-helix transcriptional regulator n=1 Tax=Ruegeria sp. PrR005 TaxID=2706882 RepID=A0A6B2NQA2_9RHOB|nr:helix-turn-helix transcriptional regulator [Ruegeria sp. PrR005]